MKRTALILAAVVAALVLSGFSRKPKEPPAVPPAAVYSLADLDVRQQEFMGVSFPGDIEGYYARLAEAGIGRSLLNVDWNTREPYLDDYNWTPLDGRIQAMGRAGIELTLTLVSSGPNWTKPTALRAGNRVPADMGHWSRFVSAVVERYDGDGIADCPDLVRPVRYFNMGNEWNSPNNASGGWAGTVPELIEYFRATHAAVKAADSRALVVMGGLPSGVVDKLAAGQIPADLEAEAARIIASTPADFVDFHQYGPESLLAGKADKIGTMAGTRPLVANEGGGPNLEFTPYSGTAHFQAVVGTYLEARAAGMHYFMWFRLVESDGATPGNRRVALFDGEGRTKPGYRACFLVAALLEGAATVTGHNPYRIDYRDGSHRFVAWNASGDGNLYTEPDGPATMVVDVETGSYEVRPAGIYPIGPLPVVWGPELRRK